MKLSKIVLAVAVVAASASSVTSAIAQAKEQFFPLLSYRTGPYAPNGVPLANGKQTTSNSSTPAMAASMA